MSMAQKLKAKIVNSRAFNISLGLFIAVFAGLGAFVLINSKAATVPGLYLNPATATVNSLTDFTVEVRENSGTTAVNAVQANLSYPATLVDFVSIDCN